MTFWIAAACLMGLACLALLSALRRKPADAIDHDRIFHDAQLSEINRQVSLKLMGDEEAALARTEVARRLLAASRRAAATPLNESKARNGAAIVVLFLLPAVSLPVYLMQGAPGMPSFPLASRASPVSADGKNVDVGAAIERIESHLAQNPDDGRGHDLLAPIYMRMGRHDDAVKAYSAAIRLLGSSTERQEGLGEALVFQGKGVVSAKARQAFDTAFAANPKQIKSRFFLAIAAEQDGDRSRAAQLLSALVEDLPEGELRREIVKQLTELKAVPSGGEAIAALPAGDQQAAIRSMVEGLAQRLAATGGSAEEWARLIRALTVLKENDRAQLILAEARQKFAGQPAQLRLIEEAASESP